MILEFYAAHMRYDDAVSCLVSFPSSSESLMVAEKQAHMKLLLLTLSHIHI